MKLRITICTMDGEVLETFFIVSLAYNTINRFSAMIRDYIEMKFDTEEE